MLGEVKGRLVRKPAGAGALGTEGKASWIMTRGLWAEPGPFPSQRPDQTRSAHTAVPALPFLPNDYGIPASWTTSLPPGRENLAHGFR